MLAPYRKVLSTPGALAFSSAGLVARLPMSTIGLGIVLLVSTRTGSYAQAGILSACYMVAASASAPLLGRLVDIVGQRRVLVPAMLGFAAGTLAMMAAVELDLPVPVPHVFAVVAGVCCPPIGACVRARWSAVLPAGVELHTAFSLEAVLDEVTFMYGPVLVAVLATQVHELAGLLVVVVLATSAGFWLASLRSSEPPVASGTGPRGPAEPLRWRWLLPMVVAAACLGSLFGATEVVTVAFAKEQHHVGLTGLLLAIWSSGSLIAGLVTGLVQWRTSLTTRYRIGAVAMAAVMVPLPFVDNIFVLAGALFLGGFAISPTLVAAIALIEEGVPAARLTEGITWISTGISIGVAPGAAIAGRLVDSYGASAGYYVPVVGGALAAVVALSTGSRRTSERRQGSDYDQSHLTRH
jgi:MFS family permease